MVRQRGSPPERRQPENDRDARSRRTAPVDLNRPGPDNRLPAHRRRRRGRLVNRAATPRTRLAIPDRGLAGRLVISPAPIAAIYENDPIAGLQRDPPHAIPWNRPTPGPQGAAAHGTTQFRDRPWCQGGRSGGALGECRQDPAVGESVRHGRDRRPGLPAAHRLAGYADDRRELGRGHPGGLAGPARVAGAELPADPGRCSEICPAHAQRLRTDGELRASGRQADVNCTEIVALLQR